MNCFDQNKLEIAGNFGSEKVIRIRFSLISGRNTVVIQQMT